MSGRVVVVPREVRQRALAQGPEGVRWLERLSGVLSALEREWNMTIGSALGGGSESYVAEATTSDGAEAIVKVALPGTGTPHQIETLLLAGGTGYVRLLRHDAGRQAMLQERLGVSLADLGLPVKLQIQVICEALRRAWDVAPDEQFLSGAGKARALAEFIVAAWEELNRPCSEDVIERALSFARAREAAFDCDSAVLVHGDAHAGNTLLVPRPRDATGARFKFVDPDGLFAERACDLAVPMRGWSRELLERDTLRLGRDRCAFLSQLTGVDAQPIWEWGFVERVSTGLLCLRVDREQLGRELLAVATAFSSTSRI
jgi:streptomycin 6-kinase